MSASLVERYEERIAGVLSCYDRVVITGTMPAVCYADGMTRFLYAHGIRVFDYPAFAQTLRDRVRDGAVALAAEAGVTIEHIAKSHIRKEEVVARVLDARGDHPGLVHILSAMEACDSYRPWHDKATGKTFVRPDSGKCLHYYFYFIDAAFGLVYLRVPTWALDGASDENANNSVVSQGVKRAAIRALTLLELVQCVDLLQKQRQGAHAVELYKTWIAFNAQHDHLYIAYYNLAALLKETGDIPGAINAFRECLRVNPRFEPARINLGRTLEDSGNSDLAVAEWEELIAATPTTTAESVGYKLMALQNIGRVLEDSEAPERAEQALL